MTNKISISVIVPVYNVEKYLNQCVDSILGQTFRNFELILVDDGSTDNSLKICKQYAKQDKRVKVIHQANGRQTKARKAGLALSKGEYIHFVDSDDWLEPNLLEVAYKAAVKDNSDVVIFDSYFNYTDHQLPVTQSIPSGFFDKAGLMSKIYPKMLYSGRFFFFGVYAAMWPKLMKKSIVVPNIENVDERIRIGEDGVTSYGVMLDANRVTVLKDQHLYHYRDNNISITRSYFEGQFESVVLLIDTLRNMNKSKNVYDLSNQIDYYFMYNIHCIFFEEFFYKFKKSYIDRIRRLWTIFNNDQVKKAAKNITSESMDRYSKRFFYFLGKRKFVCMVAASIYEAFKKRTKLKIKIMLKRY